MRNILVNYKGYSEKDREIWGYASRPEIDRDEEVILASAWEHPDSLADFRKNPVLMAFHDWHQLPLGRVREIEPREEGLFFKAQFANTEAAQEAFDFIVSTEGLSSFSVGFLPVSHEYLKVKELKKLGVDVKNYPLDEEIKTFTHVQLLEISLAPIPSSAGSTALGNAFRNGMVKSAGLRQARERYIEVIKDDTEIVVEKETIQRAIGGAVSDEVADILRRIDLKRFIQDTVKESLDLLRGRLIELDEKEDRAKYLKDK